MATVGRSSVIKYGNNFLERPPYSMDSIFGYVKKEEPESEPEVEDDLEVIFVSSYPASLTDYEAKPVVHELINLAPKSEVDESKNSCSDDSVEKASTSLKSIEFFRFVTLVDIFPDSVRKQGKAHSNSGLCSCRYCTREKEFKCDICSAQFKYRIALNQHKLLHIPNGTHTSVKTLKCNTCNAEFKYNIALNKHKLLHSNGFDKSKLKTSVIQSAEEYPFKCNTCPATFRFNYGLRKHKCRSAMKSVLQTPNELKNGLAASVNLETSSNSNSVPVMQEELMDILDTPSSSKKDLMTFNESACVLKTSNNSKRLPAASNKSTHTLKTFNKSKRPLETSIKSKLVLATVNKSPCVTKTAVKSRKVLPTSKLMTSNNEVLNKSKSVPVTLNKSPGILETSSNHGKVLTPSNKPPHIEILCAPNTSKTLKKKRTDRKLYTCPRCPNESITFIFSSKFSEHMKSLHNVERPFECEDCDATFQTSDSLNKHWKGRHSGQKLQCNLCPAQFSWRASLNNHKLTHSKEQPVSNNTQNFKRSVSISKCKKQTQKDAAPISNNACPETITGKASGKRDQKVPASKEVDEFTCAICSEVFSTKDELRIHMWIHQTEAKQPVAPTNTELPFSCSACSKKFKVKGALDRHMLVHDSRQHFSCTICSVQFKSRDNFQKHLKKTHPKVSLIECDKCPAIFESSANFREHVQTGCVNGQSQTETQKSVEQTLNSVQFIVEVNVKPRDPSQLNIRPTLNLEGKALKLEVQSPLSPMAPVYDQSTSTVVSSVKLAPSPEGNPLLPEIPPYSRPKAPLFGQSRSSSVCSETSSSSVQGTTRELNVQVQRSSSAPIGSFSPIIIKSEVEDFQPNPVLCPTPTLPPCTREPEVQNSEPEVQNSEPEVQNSEPEMQNPVPEVENPEPEVENPKSQVRLRPSTSIQKLSVGKHPHKRSSNHKNVPCDSRTYRSENIKQNGSPVIKAIYYPCWKCSEVFKLRGIRKHMWEAHKIDRPFRCNKCTATFPRRVCLNRHKHTHSVARTFKCNFCGNMYKSSETLTKHKKRLHGNMLRLPSSSTLRSKNRLVKQKSVQVGKNRALICNLCSKSFETNNHFRRHMKSVHKIDGPFVCKICNREFKNQSNLINHRKLHIDKKIYKCEMCPTTFTMNQNLKRHMKRMHFNDQIKCNLCPAVFISQKTLDDHKQRKHPFQPVNCEICGVSFSSRSFYDTHMQDHKNKKPAPKKQVVKGKVRAKMQFTCKQCTLSFNNSTKFAEHMKQVHRVERPFSCNRCSATYQLNTSLKRHLVSHSNKRPFSCEFCSARKKTKDDFNKHMKVHQSTGGSFKCNFCPASFKLEASLNKHKKAIHPKKPVQGATCTICNAKLTYKSNLLRHYKEVHCNERPLRCGQCTAPFKCKDSLSKHEKDVHGDGATFTCKVCAATFKCHSSLTKHEQAVHMNKPLFRCKVCQESFKFKSELFRHSKEVHSKKRVIKCNDCPKTFKNNEYLRRHERRMHSNGRPYECKFCSAAFEFKPELTAHILVHSDVCPFKCNICSKIYKNSFALKRHQKVVHTDERPVRCQLCGRTFKCVDSLRHHTKRAHSKGR